MSTRLNRRMVGLAASMVLVASIVVGVMASSANAQPFVVCEGSQTAEYSPPLELAYQSTFVDITEDYPLCLGGVTVGFAQEAFGPTNRSCLLPNLPFTGPDVIDYHWDTQPDSEVTFSLTTVEVAAGQTIVTAVGLVTDGYLEGAPAVREVVLPSLDLTQCLAGVDEQSGPSTLAIG